jgi:DNA-binding NarL/FixJ family response regulator
VIRVAIVDDHMVVRSGLQGLLDAEDDIEVVGTAADGADAVALLEHSPDVVLMDLSMPGVDGIEATRLVLAESPGTHVVVLTSFVDKNRIMAALEAGAVGYILKDADAGDVSAAVRAAAAGGSPLDPKVARVVLDESRRPQPTTDLSPRELEVLELVEQGMANKQIARRLGIAERTVKAHLTNVFQAIGVTDRTAAALWARENLRH